MKLKTFLSSISAMSLAASLACVAAQARADDTVDNSDRRGDSRDNDHDRDHDGNHRGHKSPRVVVISLDGAKPDFIQKFIDEGVLPRDGGLARLSRARPPSRGSTPSSMNFWMKSGLAPSSEITTTRGDLWPRWLPS